MKFYISFGQAHTHRINGQTYDCDSLMEVEYPDEITARISLNRELKTWCGIYREEQLPELISKYFNRGVINKNSPVTL